MICETLNNHDINETLSLWSLIYYSNTHTGGGGGSDLTDSESCRKGITGSSYDVRSVDVLNNLNWKTLETGRFHTKATHMYKILNDLSAPQLSNSFVKLNDININYNLRDIETDLALPRPYTNFLKRSFRYSGAMLWNNLSYEAKTAQSLVDFKHKLASSPSMRSTRSH